MMLLLGNTGNVRESVQYKRRSGRCEEDTLTPRLEILPILIANDTATAAIEIQAATQQQLATAQQPISQRHSTPFPLYPSLPPFH